jgi:hypothetical protein
VIKGEFIGIVLIVPIMAEFDQIPPRLIGCPFKITSRKYTDGRWYINLENTDHGYEATDFEGISGRSQGRKIL